MTGVPGDGSGAPGPTPGGVSVLHVDLEGRWAGGQNQLRLLMREHAGLGVDQLCLAPRGSPLVEKLRGEGLPAEAMGWRGPLDPRGALGVFARARERAVIHVHDAHALQAAIVPAKLLRRGLVAHRRVHFRTSPLTWNRADRIVAISETVAGGLLDAGVDAGRIRRIPSGIDVDEVRSVEPSDPPHRSRLGVGGDAFVVGNVAHLYPYKGLDVIPPAARELPGVAWLLAGEGPERPRLEALIAECEVEDRVHLLGAIPDGRKLLPELDAFVFTSVNEPLGTSLLDALAAGLPAVAADAHGPSEILGPVHRETGTSLYEPGDAGALADAVRRVRDDASLRRRMRAAQEERLEEYRIGRTARRILDVYGGLVEERRRRGAG